MNDIISSLFFFLVIMLSAIMHEYSHGWMADRLGDPTAKLSGRLTLNPLAHIDPVGTFLLPAIMYLVTQGTLLFAYAKPVPVNPYNLRNIRHGTAITAFAGPASNLIIAFIFGTIIRFSATSDLTHFLEIIVTANLLLAVFNLVPIPPLDGSKILFAVLPSPFHDIQVFLETYGWVFLLFFIMFFFNIIIPIIAFLFGVFTGQDVIL